MYYLSTNQLSKIRLCITNMLHIARTAAKRSPVLLTLAKAIIIRWKTAMFVADQLNSLLNPTGTSLFGWIHLPMTRAHISLFAIRKLEKLKLSQS